MAGGRRRKTGETPFTGPGLPLTGTDGSESETEETGEVAAKDAHDKKRAKSIHKASGGLGGGKLMSRPRKAPRFFSGNKLRL